MTDTLLQPPLEIVLIGIGTGNPDHLTLEAVRALNAADLVLLPRKGHQKSDLADVRHRICAVHLRNPKTRVVAFDLPERDPQTPDYLTRVRDWHAGIAAVWQAEIAAQPVRPERVALLVWGDPSLYDSTLRIAGRLRGRGVALRLRVVPGITSLQMLTARHAIPLNGLGAPVVITTGRRLRQGGFPPGTDRAAVMLDEGGAFQSLPCGDYHIYWGAYLGMEEEILLEGPLDIMGPVILARRAEARARQGWIMDIYLLQRRSPGGAQKDDGAQGD